MKRKDQIVKRDNRLIGDVAQVGKRAIYTKNKEIFIREKPKW